MASTSDIHKGVIIRQYGDLYVVVGFQHVNPGKGSAFVRTKMKNLSNGKVVENTYKTGEDIEIVQVNFQTMQYLYQNSGVYSFMNMESYEQIDMNGDLIGDDVKYLKEGLSVVIGMYQGSPVSVQIPKKVKYTVTEAPPAVKGDTASGNVTKEVTLDNGLVVKAPIFIKAGEEILVNTETGEYSERAN